MYCSDCGVAVAPGLSYCNYCGAKLGGAKGDDADESPQARPGLIVCAMVALFIFGLVAITMLMGMMKVVLGLPVGVVLAIALLAFLMMLGIEGVLIGLLHRQKEDTREAKRPAKLEGQATNELDAAHRRSLPEPVASVTEHTTRAFEPIYKERT